MPGQQTPPARPAYNRRVERTAVVQLTRMESGGRSEGEDLVAIEEPLEIRVGDRPLSVTMRTPGDDYDLAAGFLLTEGVIASAGEIDSIRHWGSPNIVRIGLREGASVDWQRLQRNFYTTSSCGVCGKTSIDALRVAVPVPDPSPRINAAVAAEILQRLRTAQPTFAATGGIHAAGIFSTAGQPAVVREDVGRHNAVDKVIGAWFRSSVTSTRPEVLAVSGRLSFELIQKAAVASTPIVIAVGAPSSLAVSLAQEVGITLIGFVREGRINVYSGLERVT